MKSISVDSFSPMIEVDGTDCEMLDCAFPSTAFSRDELRLLFC